LFYLKGGERSDKVILIEFEDRIEILPKKRPNLSQFFDTIEVDIEDVDDIFEDLKRYFNEVY